jgi:tRNA threonylcarbamoyladenosine biosynthesis protein TsaE
VSDAAPGRTISSRSVDDTVAAAVLLGRVVSKPLTIGLVGGLGAGKTQFVRGFVNGVDLALDRWVSSPTYAICHEIPHDPPILHYDLYRLEGADDLESVGFWESSPAIRIVEWPDRIPSVADALDLEIAIAITSPDTREIRMTSRTAAGEAVLAAWMDAIAAQSLV